MEYLLWLQWPATAVTVLASWFVASEKRRRRELGFWLFLLSNILWVAWGWQERAYALVAMQFCLAFMNIRGWRKNAS
ncbi:MAG: hypothetical protein ABIP38_10550 [Steroidobacteraceae bacterium]